MTIGSDCKDRCFYTISATKIPRKFTTYTLISNCHFTTEKTLNWMRTNFRGFRESTKRRIYESSEVYLYFQLRNSTIMIA
jgi:hypothetical protein